MSYRDSSDHRMLRMARSTTSLVVIALVMGAVLAAVLGGAVWLLASALHHASTA